MDMDNKDEPRPHCPHLLAMRLPHFPAPIGQPLLINSTP